MSKIYTANDPTDRYFAHYASPYYDPVKAHEYYMRTRELKGRGLNEEGKAAAEYVKNNLNEERDKKISEHKTKTSTQIEKNADVLSNKLTNSRADTDSKIKAHSEEVQSKIDQIQEKLSNLSPLQRRIQAKSLKSEIESLRASNDAKRQELMDVYNSEATKLKDANREETAKLNTAHSEYASKTKTEYEDKYINELKELRKNPNYIQPEKAAKSSSGKAKKEKEKKTKESGPTSKKFSYSEYMKGKALRTK